MWFAVLETISTFKAGAFRLDKIINVSFVRIFFFFGMEKARRDVLIYV